jgi:spoIIIJ-associated protein
MKYFEVEGKTSEQAVSDFLAENDIPKDFIEYEVLESGSKGFFGFGSKSALVKIKFNDTEFYKRKGRLLLSELLEKAGFNDFSIETKMKHPDIVLNIVSPDSKLLIGKSAQMLDSMQYILNRMINWNNPESTFIVDVEDYRERVVENLKEKAVKLAKTVRRTGKPIKMAPMVTMVRKEIHMALKQVQGISTVSKGDGYLKEILIVPEKRSGRGRRPEGGGQGRPEGGNQNRPQRTRRPENDAPQQETPAKEEGE